MKKYTKDSVRYCVASGRGGMQGLFFLLQWPTGKENLSMFQVSLALRF